MDGESAEAVTNERHKVHFRPALVPHATLSGHHRHSQAQAYHGRRIVIPKVTRDNQAEAVCSPKKRVENSGGNWEVGRRTHRPPKPGKIVPFEPAISRSNALVIAITKPNHYRLE